MSLKAFHLIFITASTLLCAGFGFWSIRQYQNQEGTAGDLALGIVSLMLVVGLIIYGKYFLRKLRHISYL
jgi:hypothetical protein